MLTQQPLDRRDWQRGFEDAYNGYREDLTRGSLSYRGGANAGEQLRQRHFAEYERALANANRAVHPIVRRTVSAAGPDLADAA